MLGETQPLGGEAVEVRGGEALLPVATEVAVAEVIGEDEDQVGRAGGRGGEGRGGSQQQER